MRNEAEELVTAYFDHHHIEIKTLNMKLSFRNHSAHQLSLFAESCMALNRVLLQHFSMNQDEELENMHADEPPFGLSPPSESRLAQRRLRSLSLNTEHLLTATG